MIQLVGTIPTAATQLDATFSLGSNIDKCSLFDSGIELSKLIYTSSLVVAGR